MNNLQVQFGRIIIGFDWLHLILAAFIYAAIPPVFAETNNLPDSVEFRISIELGDTEKAEKWLNAGLTPDFLGDKLGSALHIAAWNGDIKMMNLFLNKGAKINLLNKNGETPLHMAALQGKNAAAEWLMTKGANVLPPSNQSTQTGAWSALHYAAFSGKKELVSRLLEKGADINARAPNGTTPLMAAIYEGKRDLAEYLVKQGADRTLRNDWGDGAFEWAMKYNQTDLARLISSPEQFSSAYSRPKSDWDKQRRSEAAPPELLKLLDEREKRASQKAPTESIDTAIATLRAKIARETMAEIKDRFKPTITVLPALIIRPTPNQLKLQ